MKKYKVLKNFPSMRGRFEYKVGETVKLDDNERTKNLVKMGYINKVAAETPCTPLGTELAAKICHTVSQIEGIKDVSVSEAGTGRKHHAFLVRVEEL